MKALSVLIGAASYIYMFYGSMGALAATVTGTQTSADVLLLGVTGLITAAIFNAPTKQDKGPKDGPNNPKEFAVP